MRLVGEGLRAFTVPTTLSAGVRGVRPRARSTPSALEPPAASAVRAGDAGNRPDKGHSSTQEVGASTIGNGSPPTTSGETAGASLRPDTTAEDGTGATTDAGCEDPSPGSSSSEEELRNSSATSANCTRDMFPRRETLPLRNADVKAIETLVECPKALSKASGRGRGGRVLPST